VELRHPLWRTQSLVVAPAGAGRGYTVDITDRAGVTLATCDAEGAVRDQLGEQLLAAPLDWQGRRDKALSAVIEIADPEGRALGTGRIVKYGMGPRSRKATIAVVDPHGAEAVRLEPRDKRGEQLAVTTNGTELGTVAVSTVKQGFLRKAHVYELELTGRIPDELRPLVLAAAIRYDALLNAIVTASRRD
jgi:hypothetical protein